MRPSDNILCFLNRIHDAKQSGTLAPDELYKTIDSIVLLFSNMVENGHKVDIEGFMSHLPRVNVFARDHKNIEKIIFAAEEALDMAQYKIEERGLSTERGLDVPPKIVKAKL